MNLAPFVNTRIQSLVERTLSMRVNIYSALDTFLPHISPTAARHPDSLALGTFVLPETPVVSLIWCKSDVMSPGQGAHMDKVPGFKAQVTEICAWWLSRESSGESHEVQLVSRLEHYMVLTVVCETIVMRGRSDRRFSTATDVSCGRVLKNSGTHQSSSSIVDSSHRPGDCRLVDITTRLTAPEECCGRDVRVWQY